MELRIKDICNAKGIAMKQLAEMLRIAPTSLSRSLNNNPTLDTLNRIAQALGVEVVELFEQKPANNVFTCPKCGTRFEIKEKQ